MRASNRENIKEQISNIIDEVSIQELTPTEALRQVMYFFDLYGHHQKLIGMEDITEIYKKGAIK